MNPEADKTVAFIESALKATTGRDVPLEPWQKKLIGDLSSLPPRRRIAVALGKGHSRRFAEQAARELLKQTATPTRLSKT